MYGRRALLILFFTLFLLEPACSDGGSGTDPVDVLLPSDSATPHDLEQRDTREQDTGATDTSAVDTSTADTNAADTAVADTLSADTTPLDTETLDTGVDQDDFIDDGCHVRLPERAAMAPLVGDLVHGSSEATSADGYIDHYLYSANGDTKVGVREDWGGAVIFYGRTENAGPGLNHTNVIDANDTGREVQVAFYNPDRRHQNCAHDATCASSDSDCQPATMSYLGWNPVQGGNRCNQGSGVDHVVNADGVLEVKTTPLQWNPAWDRADCFSDVCEDAAYEYRRSDVEVTQTLRFIQPHIVELGYIVQNLSDLNHGATGHEMPTVYTANGQQGPDLWRFMDSNGTQHTIDIPTVNGLFRKPITSPGGWVSMQNEDLSYGVGMYYETRLTEFAGYQHRDIPFNNFRAKFSFAIPAYGTIHARAYLLLGSQAAIGDAAAWLDAALAPFGVMDAPAWDTTVSGPQAVRGWALDNRGVTGIELWVDGAFAAALNYGGSRPDVCAVWPGYADCNGVGYSGQFDFSTLTACEHLLEVKAHDSSGNTRVIARNRVTVTH